MKHARTGRVLRPIAAVLLLVIAGIHLNLYLREEYNKIPTVGFLFLLTSISAVLLSAALFVRPVGLFDGLAGLFALGVLGGYLLTLLLPAGLFSFKEPGVSYSGGVSVTAEATTVLVSALLVRRRARPSRRLASAPTPARS